MKVCFVALALLCAINGLASQDPGSSEMRANYAIRYRLYTIILTAVRRTTSNEGGMLDDSAVILQIIRDGIADPVGYENSADRPETHELYDPCLTPRYCHEITCADREARTCPKTCYPGRYICEAGYIRKFTDGPCILVSDCPAM